MAGVGVTELLIVVVVVVVLFSRKNIGTGGATLSEFGGVSWLSLIGIGIAGALVEEARWLAVNVSLLSEAPEIVLRVSGALMLRSAILWMILGASLRAYWSSRTHRNLLAATIVVWIVKTPASMFLDFLYFYLMASGNSSFGLTSYYSVPANWVRHILAFPLTWPTVVTAFLLVLCTRFATRRMTIDGSTSAASWSGYGGISMKANTNQTTRFLCASAYLGSPGFCERIVHYYDNATQAVAPEVGLDIPLLLGVCRAAMKRHLAYHLSFLGLALIGLVAVAASESPAAVAGYVIFAAALFFTKSYVERYQYAKLFRQGAFDPDAIRTRLNLAVDDHIKETLPSDEQNLIVYSGFVPFVGAGTDLGGWSFSAAIDKPRQSLGAQARPKKFNAPELYAAIRTAVTNLGIDGLDVRDMCFVHGSDIREDREILPNEFGRPKQRLSDEQSSRYSDASDPRVRHYQWIRVRDWGNDLVVSYFLRCALRGQSLFVEIKRFLLPPLADQYRTVDSLGNAEWHSVLGLLSVSLVAGPLYPIYSVLTLTSRFSRGLSRLLDREGRRRRRQIRRSPLYNYGTDRALRQQLSSDRFVHYFQKLDDDFYGKVLERTVLDEIVSFLDERDIDTSDIKERQTTILNSGIIVQSGDVNAKTLAVGAGARAATQAPRRERKILRRGASA